MTTIPPTLTRLLAGACALALCVTACGGTDDAGGAATTATTATGPAGDAGAAKAARRMSPLDEFLGFGVEPSAEQVAEDEQHQREAERLIAECMRAQGFEYTPYDPAAAAPEAGPWDLPPDEFARQYGYGITTIDREVVGSGDPNAAAIEAMSIPEQQAYYQALYGDAIGVDENGDLTKRTPPAPGAAAPPATESCSARASAEVYGEAETTTGDDDDPFAPLQEEMGALYERVEQDSRVADARAAWSACMADAGYPGLEDIYDASVDVGDRAAELLGESMDAAAAEPAALDELRTHEIAVATADFACRVDYDAVREVVQAELEESFIDEHRAELEQYRDAIAAGAVGVG